MENQIKAWAVVRPDGTTSTAHSSRELAESVVEDYVNHGLYDSCSVIELVQAPEKIKMTQAEFDEFLELKNGKGTLFFALEKATVDSLMFKRLHNNSNENEDNKAQLEFARLWASDNPAELVEIEKEKRYWLVSKLDKDVFVSKVGNDFILVRKPKVTDVFSQPGIDELGGDDWLAEMGLKKVGVEE